MGNEHFKISGKDKDYLGNILTVARRQFQEPKWIDFKFVKKDTGNKLYIESTDYHIDAIMEINAPGFIDFPDDSGIVRKRCSADSIAELLTYFKNEKEILCAFTGKEICAKNDSEIAKWKKPLLEENGNYVKLAISTAYDIMLDSELLKSLAMKLTTFGNLDKQLNSSIAERTGYMNITPEKFDIYVLSQYMYFHYFKNAKSSIGELPRFDLSLNIEDALCIKGWYLPGILKIRKDKTLIINNQNFWFTIPDQFPGDEVINAFKVPITNFVENTTRVAVDSSMFDTYGDIVMTGAKYAILEFGFETKNKLKISAYKDGDNGYLGQYVDIDVVNPEPVLKTIFGVSSIYMNKIAAAKKICNNNFRFLLNVGTVSQNFGVCSDEFLIFMPPYGIKI